MKHFALFLILFLSAALPSVADDDVVLRALTDEMNRSIKELHLGNNPPPYYLRYTIKDVDSVRIMSSLGSEAVPQHSRYRFFVPDVRDGSSDLDNSNYGSVNSNYFAHGSYVSIDDDYKAIRRSVWLQTDGAYKAAIRTLAAKKSYLSENKIADRLPDMTAVRPVTSINPTTPLRCDESHWTKLVQQLSALFSKYPQIQKSNVTFVARQTCRWLVTSEGTRIRDCQPKYGIVVWASTQAPDGTPISDWDTVVCNDENQLPDYEKLKTSVETFAGRMSDWCSAKEGDDYCGPVLLEPQAAAELIMQIMAPNLCSDEERVHPTTAKAESPEREESDTTNSGQQIRNPLRDMVGRKIFPKYVSLIDDPLLSEFHGMPLVGGYRFDEQGTPAEKVVLAENGVLKGFCQSRVPTRNSRMSNGHAVEDRSDTSILELTSSQTSSPEELKQKLLELGKEEGMKYVLVISRIFDGQNLDQIWPPNQSLDRMFPSQSRQPTDPLVVYRVDVQTGQKEMVRGLEFRYVSLRSFRDIRGVGDDAKPCVVQPDGTEARHLISPSYIVGELELSKMSSEHKTLPKLASPLVSK